MISNIKNISKAESLSPLPNFQNAPLNPLFWLSYCPWALSSAYWLQFSKNLAKSVWQEVPPLKSDLILISHTGYLINLCLQQEFHKIYLLRIPLPLMSPFSNIPSTDRFFPLIGCKSLQVPAVFRIEPSSILSSLFTLLQWFLILL